MWTFFLNIWISALVLHTPFPHSTSTYIVEWPLYQGCVMVEMIWNRVGFFSHNTNREERESSPNLSTSLLFMENVYPKFLFIYFINIQWWVLYFNTLINVQVFTTNPNLILWRIEKEKKLNCTYYLIKSSQSNMCIQL